MLERIQTQPFSGLICMLTVWAGMALGHSLVVTQWAVTGGIGVIDSLVSLVLTIAGFTCVWIGLKKPESQATILGYVGGNLIWVGLFEWTWHYFGHWLKLEPITDNGYEIIAPGLLMIQSTSLICVALLVFLGANKDTRCRMFMWFHRNFKLRPGQMTAGYKRQHARTAAMETIFIIWFIYICAIMINDPRLIKYDSVAAMVITVGFVIWGIYLVTKLVQIRGLGSTFRYAIPTGSILWLPVEAFSRWGLYPEIWIKPAEYVVPMLGVLGFFIVMAVAIFRTDSVQQAAAA